MLLCLLGAATVPSRAADKAGWDVILAIRGGYCNSAGHYAGRLGNGWNAGFSISPWRYMFIHPDLDFRYAAFDLRRGVRSSFTSMSASAGLLLEYPVLPSMHVYGGAYFQESYIRLRGDALTGNRVAYKPGLMVRGGIDIPLRWGIMLRFGVDYSYSIVSNRDYHSLYYAAGIVYNRGVQVMEASRMREDKDVSERDRLAREKRQKALVELRRARELFAGKQPYNAIAALEPIADSLPEAADELAKMRASMKGDVPILEKQGMDAYEKSDYERCIFIMRRLKLIEPSNRTVGIYLPRAIKRYEALKKLK